MSKFPPQDPRGAAVAPDPGQSAEYELADQDVDRVLQRPDTKSAPSSPPADAEDVRRGHEKFERLIAK